MGIGWVKFPRASAASYGIEGSTEVASPPLLRCFGMQRFAAAPPGARPDHAVPMVARSARQAAVGETSTAAAYSGVAEETWAVACLGSFSLHAPATKSSTGSFTEASDMLQCSVRCRGISMRLDVADEQASHTTTAPTPAPSRGIARAPVVPEQAVALAGSGAQAVGAIAARARAMLQMLVNAAGKADESLADSLGAGSLTAVTSAAGSTVTAARRICGRSARIAQRSVEHVGQAATAPLTWRRGGAASGDQPGGDGPLDDDE